MKAILQTGFLTLAIMALAVPASAGPFEDGVAAYQQGDYVTALKFFNSHILIPATHLNSPLLAVPVSRGA